MPDPAGISLDQPPAQPPSLNGPQASIGGMIGQMSPGGPPGGGPGLQGAAGEIMAKAMQAEKLLNDLASILPGFRPIAEQIVSVLRQGVVRSLQPAGGLPAGGGGPAGPTPGGSPMPMTGM